MNDSLTKDLEDRMRLLAPSLAAVCLLLASKGALADDAEVKARFEAKCQKCHGADGKAQTRMGRKLHADDFTTEKWQKEQTEKSIIRAITNGAGKKKRMPAFKGKLTAGQIKELAAYLRTFAEKPATDEENSKPPVAAPTSPEPGKPE